MLANSSEHRRLLKITRNSRSGASNHCRKIFEGGGHRRNRGRTLGYVGVGPRRRRWSRNAASLLACRTAGLSITTPSRYKHYRATHLAAPRIIRFKRGFLNSLKTYFTRKQLLELRAKLELLVGELIAFYCGTLRTRSQMRKPKSTPVMDFPAVCRRCDAASKTHLGCYLPVQ